MRHFTYKTKIRVGSKTIDAHEEKTTERDTLPIGLGIS